jgi:large subunit ribosomal protein L6
MRALVGNMLTGVTQGFTRQLEINGVGYKAEIKGPKIVLSLGYSHPIEYQLPEGITAKVDKNLLILSGIDRQALGAASAKIRSFRPPEPYKGKGIKYIEETILRKAGKTAGK